MQPAAPTPRSIVQALLLADGPSGPDLQRELGLRRQRIPIVFITAHGDEAIRPRVLAQGAVECLLKPFSDADLHEALDAALQTN